MSADHPPANPNEAPAVYCPILMYHWVSERPEKDLYPWTISPALFARHLDYLRDAGYTTLTMAHLWDAMNGRSALPARPVVLTFDDGYWDIHANAAPLLRQRDMTAVFYIVSGFMAGEEVYLTWEQTAELAAQGFEIGCHSHDHPNMAALTYAEQRADIATAQEMIADRLSITPTSFCYPMGRYNEDSLRAVADLGFHTAVTTADATLHALPRRLTLGRVRVRPDTSPRALGWLMNRRVPPADRLRLLRKGRLAAGHTLANWLP